MESVSNYVAILVFEVEIWYDGKNLKIHK